MSALLTPNEILSMSAQAAHRLVELGDGDCALLYLALLERGGDALSARSRLGWPEERLTGAWSRLAARGLVTGTPALPDRTPPAQDDRIPDYNRGDIVDALTREQAFAALYREMERTLNRTLSDADLKTLYTLYDYLALPPEVILMLTRYVCFTLRRQKGPGSGSFPRMSQIRKEAFLWKRLGVTTVEGAEDYIRRQALVDGREWAILSAVGVTTPRPAVEKEREYIAKWVEMGVSDQLIRLAYERTVYRKGAMNWPYVNRILQSWHQAGYTTPAQVEAAEGARRSGTAAPPAPKHNDYQPSQARIRKSGDWLDEFLKEQEKAGDPHGI